MQSLLCEHERMRIGVRILLLLLAAVLCAQDTVYVCPMDPDVRSNQPGKCPRCGMTLRAGLPEPVEYRMDFSVTPRPVKPNQKTTFAFTVRDPWKNRPVRNFQIVHERLFHMFVVGQNLEFFVHDHPTLRPDGTFVYDIALPQAGMYRILGDFYPDGATPQLIAKTLIVPGPAPAPVSLTRDYAPNDAANMRVSFRTEPPEPISGMRTQLHFHIEPAEGLELYLGAWGHMLAASDDLIDLIHTHPFLANGGDIQFNVDFPRARAYRVWVQFQRKGVVNTVRFDVPVKDLEQATKAQ
jgi:hypothetical protein